MEIKGYLRTSLLEWPGKISSVIFVPGCNFRCPFCHNRDLVLNPEKLPSISEEEIFSDLKGRKKWIDGIAVTGGEPTLQPDLPEFLGKIKNLGFLTMVETNGTFPRTLERLINKGLVDRIAMDIKGPLDERYGKVTGIGNWELGIGKSQKLKDLLEDVEKSIKLILNSEIEYEFRTTVVPTLLTKKDLVDLAKQLRNISHQSLAINHSLSWFLQQFWPKNCLDPTFEKIKSYDKKYLEEILSAVKKYITSAELRGV